MSWLTSWWKKDEKKDNQKERIKLDKWTELQDINDYKEQRIIRSIELDPNDQSTIIFYFNKQISNTFLNDFLLNNTLQIVLSSVPDLNNQFKSIMESGTIINRMVIKVDEFVLKKTTNEFDLSFIEGTVNTIKIVYDEGIFEKAVGTDIILDYAIGELYCINTTTMPVTLNISNELSEISFTNYIPYDHLYLTNVKGSTVYQATKVNYITEGEVSTYYNNYIPLIVNTINAPPAPGETVTQEIYMDLSNIYGSIISTKFGTIEDGVYISQKIYPNKVIVYYYNYEELVNLNMMSGKKSDNGEYKKTIICTVVPEDAVSSESVTFPTESNDTVRLTFDTTEPDLFGDQFSFNIKITQYVNGKKFADNIKEKLELYIDTMIIKDNEKNAEFTTYQGSITEVSVYYTINGNDYGVKQYSWNNTTRSYDFKTRVGTLYMISTENEKIKPITYSFELNRVLISEMNYKVSRVNIIDVANVINTLLSGSGNENKINKRNIILVNNGVISKTFYEKVMPITGKKIGEMSSGSINYGFINYNGDNSGEDLVGINTSFEEECITYKSSMNLISIEEVNISKFGTVKDSDPNVLDKQNVFLSSILVYDNQVNLKVSNAGLMSRNVASHGKTLGDGETPNYLPTNVVYQRDDIIDEIDKYNLVIREQNCNNFLKSITETESGTEITYTDVYLNQDCSSSFQESNINMLRVSKLFLLNEYRITFNGGDNMGKLRIHYIKSNPEEGDTLDEFGYVVYVPSSPNYEVRNLYITSGEYKDNTSNLIPHPINWTENGNDHHVFNRTEENGEVQISIDLMYKEGLIYIVDVSSAYCINTLVTDEDKDYNCYLIISGEIPQWVFKDLLPLPRSINKQGNITSTYTGKYISGINTFVENTGVSKTDNTNNLIESEIDLTNVADLEIFNRIYEDGFEDLDKVFFVNKVKVLKRFKDKINTNGNHALFQYYDGMTINPSTVEFVDDWALKLPECYEECELSGTELTVKFGKYLQLDYIENNELIREYLFNKLFNNDNHYYYLDLSMKTKLDLSNITKLNIYLDILKYITWINIVMLFNPTKIYIIFNKNGFLESKEISRNNIKQEINKCYLIYETFDNIKELNRDNILIKPAGDVFNSENNIKLYDSFSTNSNTKINNLKCTNIYQILSSSSNYKFPPNTEVNLLVSGDIPSWLSKYFYKENKALPIKVKSGNRNGFYEIVESDNSTEVTDEYFMITSINALPAPGIGIDNLEPDNQCNLNLEDFISPPEEEP